MTRRQWRNTQIAAFVFGVVTGVVLLDWVNVFLI